MITKVFDGAIKKTICVILLKIIYLFIGCFNVLMRKKVNSQTEASMSNIPGVYSKMDTIKLCYYWSYDVD